MTKILRFLLLTGACAMAQAQTLPDTPVATPLPKVRAPAGYGNSIAERIKNNIVYAGRLDMEGNPYAIFRLEQLPNGEIIEIKRIRSSGVPAFDTAVGNAIAKASPLPKKLDGTTERVIELTVHLKDLPKTEP